MMNVLVRRFADLGAHHNGDAANFRSNHHLSFGPRLSLRRSKVTPYVQALFGGAHVSSSPADRILGATALFRDGLAAASAVDNQLPAEGLFLFGAR